MLSTALDLQFAWASQAQRGWPASISLTFGDNIVLQEECVKLQGPAPKMSAGTALFVEVRFKQVHGPKSRSTAPPNE